MKISYDYDELITELKSDIAEGLIKPNELIAVVRGDEKYGYSPIIDYYFEYDDVIEDYQEELASEVLSEMERMNNIL